MRAPSNQEEAGQGILAIILARQDLGLQQIFGIAAVRRLTLHLLRLGVKNIYFLGRVQALKPALSDLIPQDSFRPLGDPSSLRNIAEQFARNGFQKALVLQANHVLDRQMFSRLLASGGSSVSLVHGEKENDGDGVYLTDLPSLPRILQHLWTGSSNSLKGEHHHLGAAGLPYLLPPGDQGVRTAEEKLMRALAFQTRETDGFLACHVSRRVSRFFSRRLVLTRVTPNQITLMGVAIGLLGAFLLSWPGYWPKLIGSLLFLLCIIMDGIDGEIARLKLMESHFGHRLDIITDNIVHVAIFLGITVGLYHDSGATAFWILFGALLGGFSLCLVAVYQCILKRGEDAQSSPAIRFFTLLCNRDFAYLLVGLALAGRLHWFLMGASVGTYLFAGILWALHFRGKRGQGAFAVRAE